MGRDHGPGARRGRDRGPRRRRARRVRRRLPRAGDPRQRALRGQVPAGVRAEPPGDLASPRARGARVRRRCRRARLHRQGQRPGALRGVGARAGARPRRARARAGVGHDPRRLHRLRREVRHPDQRHQEEPVLDRREPLGPGHRVRHARGPVGGAAGRRLHAHPRHRGRAERAQGDRGALRAGRPRRARRRGEAAPRARHRAGQRGGRLRLGSARHGREPPRRHQEPRDLRVPGFARGAARPRRPRVDRARARPHAREGAARAPLRGAGVRRSLVLAAQGGPRRVHGLRADPRDR